MHRMMSKKSQTSQKLRGKILDCESHLTKRVLHLEVGRPVCHQTDVIALEAEGHPTIKVPHTSL